MPGDGRRDRLGVHPEGHPRADSEQVQGEEVQAQGQIGRGHPQAGDLSSGLGQFSLPISFVRFDGIPEHSPRYPRARDSLSWIRRTPPISA